MADKKTYVFYILNILRKYTDDDTYITKGKICAHDPQQRIGAIGHQIEKQAVYPLHQPL